MWEGVITEKQEKQEPKEQSQATQAFSAALLKNMDYNIKRTEALEYQPTRDDSIVSYSRDLVAILKPYRPDATGTSSGAWYSDAAEFFNEGRDLF